MSPLAVQGPKSDELMDRVFGREIEDLKCFRRKTSDFDGKGTLVARSGYSKQGGFEIYLEGFEYGEALWDTFDIPLSRSVESGQLFEIDPAKLFCRVPDIVRGRQYQFRMRDGDADKALHVVQKRRPVLLEDR